MATKTVGVALTADGRGLQSGLAAGARQIRTFAYEVGVASQSIVNRTTVMQAGLAAAGVATVLAFRSTVGAAIGFEVEMRNVNSIMHETEEQFEATSRKVLGLTRELPQDAQTLARGLYDIASSGFQGAEGIEVLEQSARAATAGMTDTATAARGITAVLNAYGLEAKDASDVSDILFQTVNLGVVTFEELASQLGDVVGTAAAGKVPIDEVGSALAAMTLSGISSAESATSLNRVLQTLVDPGEALSAVLRNVGYESGAAALEQDGLFGTMMKLRGAVGDNVEILLALFPEIRAARGAFALLAAEGENYRTTQEGITNEQARAQATQKAFDEQMKAIGNQLKLARNAAAGWGIEVGSKVLPVLGKLINVGKDVGRTVLPVFRAGGEVLSFWGSTLASHEEIIIAIGIAYGAKLAAGIALAVLNFGRLAVAAGVARVQALQSSAAWLGWGVAIGGVAIQAAAAGALIVAAMAISDWHQARAAAKAYVDEIERGYDLATTKGRQDLSSRLHDEAAAFERNHEVTEGWGSALRGVISSLPGMNHDLRDNTMTYEELTKAMERNSIARLNEINNVIAIRKATGASVEQIRKLAKDLGVDLTVGAESAGNAIKRVTGEIEAQAEAVGLTREQFAQLGPEAIEAMQQAEAAAKDAKDAFLQAFGLLNGLEFPNAEEAAEKAADALDKVASAEERLADAQDKVNENLRYLSRTPDRNKDLARARRDVADAERDLADAREKSREASQRLLSPEETIIDQYRKQVEAAEAFLENIDKAARRGIDPQFLQRALAAPEEFGPILEAIANDADGHLTEIVNTSEAKLRDMSDRLMAISQLVSLGVRENMDSLSTELLDGIERALTQPTDSIRTLAYQIGAEIREGVMAGVQGGARGDTQGPDAFGRSPGDPDYGSDPFPGGGGGDFGGHGASGSFAGGGIQPHVAKSTMIKYGEPSTGGEAYIPLGDHHRPRSSALLGQVASRFGYGLVEMQRGGLVGTGWSTPAPAHYSKKTSYNLNGPIHFPSARELESHLDRKSRLSALAGSN